MSTACEAATSNFGATKAAGVFWMNQILSFTIASIPRFRDGYVDIFPFRFIYSSDQKGYLAQHALARMTGVADLRF